MPSDASLGQVFVNCPFHESYDPQFNAMVFALARCSFTVRSARERDDGGQLRIDKILGIIDESDFGIHDISFTDLDTDSGLPRFNMPFELGLDLGARHFGDADHKEKQILILDREQYRFQKFLSDIAGQDPKSHDGDVAKTVDCVRTFLNSLTKTRMPSTKIIMEAYESFLADLPALCENNDLDHDALDYHDYYWAVIEWITGR